jgi:hypothetical protein
MKNLHLKIFSQTETAPQTLIRLLTATMRNVTVIRSHEHDVTGVHIHAAGFSKQRSLPEKYITYLVNIHVSPF